MVIYFLILKWKNFKFIIILLNLYFWVLLVCRFGIFKKNYFDVSNMKLRYNESKLKMIFFV